MFQKIAALVLLPAILNGEIYLGNYNTDNCDPNSVNNPHSKYGNTHYMNSIHNKYGRYGDAHSDYSVTNPYAVHAPKLFDQHGNYRGRLSLNKHDPDSINNPYGRYGSRYSPDSINNPWGPGRTLGYVIIEIWGE